MAASPATLSADRPGGARAILWGGLIAGALDITYAIVFYYFWSGVAPAVILQSVASGLLGRASYGGGFATAALGLFLHFLIAYIWATIYYLASRKLDRARARAVRLRRRLRRPDLRGHELRRDTALGSPAEGRAAPDGRRRDGAAHTHARHRTPHRARHASLLA